jgi:hypothetical protein
MSLPDDQGLTQAAPAATIAATIILNKALSLGIRVLTDGDQLAMLVPVKLPRAVRVRFENLLYEFRTEIVALIQAQNPGGRA